MKKILSLVLSLAMVLSLTTVVWGATGTGTEADPYQVSNEAELIEAVGLGGYIKLADSFSVTSAGGQDGLISITDGKIVNLDMNGKTITVTDPKSSGNYSLFYIVRGAKLTITGNGTITLTATTDRDWNAMSTIIYNRGGELTIENGTFTNNGGTDMAFVVDNNANSYGDATTNIDGGTLSSTYIAIRNSMVKVKLVSGTNVNGTAYLYVNDGTISGTSRAIWGQVASADVNGPATGEISISGGNVGLVDVGRSDGADCMTTISGNAVVEAVKAEEGEVSITGGTVTDSLTILTASGDEVTEGDFITGGTFYFDVSNFVAEESVNDVVITDPPSEEEEDEDDEEEDTSSEPTPAEIERDRVVEAILEAEDGETVVLDVKDTNVVSRLVADALSGKNVNLEYALGEETVTVNGKNVPKSPAYRVWYSLELFAQFA